MNKIIVITLIMLINFSCSDKKKYKEFIKSESRYYYVVGKINGPVKSIHLTSSNDYNDDKMDYTYLIDTVKKELLIYLKDRLDNTVYLDSKGKVDSNIWYKDDLRMKTLYHKTNFHEMHFICTMNEDSVYFKSNDKLDTINNTCIHYSDKGTLTRIDSFDISGNMLVSTFDKITVRYEYNEQGDLICETKEFNDSDEKFKSQILDYKYDKYGNWIEKEIERYYRGQKKPEYTMIKKREIQYY